MTKISFDSNYGSFAYRMTAEIGEDVNEQTKALCLQGLANICYRTVGSNVDKSLGVKSAKNGGHGRAAVLYSEADGERINAAVSEKITEMEADAKTGGMMKALKLSFAVIGEYIPTSGDAKPSKEAEAKWTEIQGYPTERFAKACAQLGIDPENYDDETGVAAVHRYLLEAVRKAREAAKSGL